MKYRWPACVSVAAFIFTSQPLFGVPGFARKYETSCTTCHVLAPKLNAFGRAFRNLGYRMPGGDEGAVKQKEVSLGAPAWKRVWPKGVWPSTIPGGEFMAIALTTNFEVNPSEKVSNSFDGIGEVGLLLGGTLGESFSFFGDIDLFENGEPGGIGRLFFQYNNPGRKFNVRVGQFEPRAAPFSSHLRITRSSNYLTNVFPMVETGNFFGFSPNQRGIELWGGREGPGGGGGLIWSFGVVNGEFGGASEALERSVLDDTLAAFSEAQEQYGPGDYNSEKDFYFSGSYKIGGMGVFGSGMEGVTQQTNNWRDNSLTLGGYLYRGVAGAFDVENGVGDQQFFNNGNTFYRGGVSFDAWLQDLNVFGAYQRNNDRLNPIVGCTKCSFNTDILMVEANYVTPWPWVQPAVRLEQVQPDFARTFNRTTLSLSMMVRANAILTFDGVLKGSNVPDLPPFDDRFRVGFRLYF